MRTPTPTRILGAALALAGLAASFTSGSASSAPTLTNAKFSITTLDGSVRLSDSFGATSPVAALANVDGGGAPARLEADEILRLSFELPRGADEAVAEGESSSSESQSQTETESESEEEVIVDGQVVSRSSSRASSRSRSSSTPNAANALPQQVVVQLVPSASSSSPHGARSPATAGFPATLHRSTGRVAWSQRVDRLPASLASHDATYTLRLLLGGGGGKGAGKSASLALSLDLGQVHVPSLALPLGAGASTAKSSGSEARETKAREMGFHPWEERRHTFRKEVTEGMPGEKGSLLVAAGVVGGPWLVLAALLTPLLPSLRINTAPRLATSILFASLLFLEVIAARYYRGDFTLFKMLPYFALGAAVASGAVLAGGVRGVGLRSGAGK